MTAAGGRISPPRTGRLSVRSRQHGAQQYRATTGQPVEGAGDGLGKSGDVQLCRDLR